MRRSLLPPSLRKERPRPQPARLSPDPAHSIPLPRGLYLRRGGAQSGAEAVTPQPGRHPAADHGGRHGRAPSPSGAPFQRACATTETEGRGTEGPGWSRKRSRDSSPSITTARGALGGVGGGRSDSMVSCRAAPCRGGLTGRNGEGAANALPSLSFFQRFCF